MNFIKVEVEPLTFLECNLISSDNNFVLLLDVF